MSNLKKPYVIPAQPKVLINVIKLLDADDINIDSVVSEIRKDVSLYSAVLATSNTPAFGGSGKTKSLKDAVMRIGFNKMLTILRLLALKNAFSKVKNLDAFWDTATEVAELTMSIAKKFSNEDVDEAYSLGMMHNCGIPMMLEAVKDYQVFLDGIDTGLVNSWLDSENDIFGMNHIQISHKISQRWLMPENVTSAIILQRKKITDLDLSNRSNESVNFLLCSLLLAKDISSAYRNYWDVSDTSQQHKHIRPVLDFVGISETDYGDMREEYLLHLGTKEA
jgi:HD-like signal output (HDOD) protein